MIENGTKELNHGKTAQSAVAMLEKPGVTSMECLPGVSQQLVPQRTPLLLLEVKRALFVTHNDIWLFIAVDVANGHLGSHPGIGVD